MAEPPRPGQIIWHDLTVEDADGVRDFYSAVVGWEPAPLDMGGYSDYVMAGPDGRPAAGVCHARGSNESLPPQWLAYVVVDDLDASLDQAEQLGGRVVDGPRPIGEGSFCVIADPAGAVIALIDSAGAVAPE
jgi:predicted enzyme related to lactoylglutathione lyase